jgi:hypothetical protein
VIKQYESASSYQDAGVLTILPKEQFLDGLDREAAPSRPDSQTAISFRTYFKRPRMFRFEWQSALKRSSRDSVVWFDGKNAFSWTTNSNLDEQRYLFSDEPDFYSLIENRISSTGGMIFTIPSLLMPNLAPYTFRDVLKDLAELDLIKEQMIEGEMCYVIKGTASTVPWLFWIGKKTHLLRKSRSLGSIGSFHERLTTGASGSFVLEETRSHIRINTLIPSYVFRFRPDLKAGDLDATRSPNVQRQ